MVLKLGGRLANPTFPRLMFCSKKLLGLLPGTNTFKFSARPLVLFHPRIHFSKNLSFWTSMIFINSISLSLFIWPFVKKVHRFFMIGSSTLTKFIHMPQNQRLLFLKIILLNLVLFSKLTPYLLDIVTLKTLEEKWFKFRGPLFGIKFHSLFRILCQYPLSKPISRNISSTNTPMSD